MNARYGWWVYGPSIANLDEWDSLEKVVGETWVFWRLVSISIFCPGGSVGALNGYWSFLVFRCGGSVGALNGYWSFVVPCSWLFLCPLPVCSAYSLGSDLRVGKRCSSHVTLVPTWLVCVGETRRWWQRECGVVEVSLQQNNINNTNNSNPWLACASSVFVLCCSV